MSIPTPAELSFLQSLAPPDPHWGGMGARRRIPDARDYPATAHPEVQAALARGVPDNFDISSSVCEILNQGATGACVCFSTCHGIQVNDNLDSRVCYHFNAAQLYQEMGGTGQNGVDSQGTLKRCEDVGAPTLGGARVRIGSYFWIDQTPGNFEQQVKAALSTGKAVVLATLLPTTFAGRWSPGTPTAGYHQLCVTRYAGDLFGGPNSWGADWGNHGFYELAFGYVQQNDLLQRYTFALFFDTLGFSPPPPPPPPRLAVTGYNPAIVTAGQSFQIQGAGFAPGMTATFLAVPLSLTLNSATLATALAPPETALAQGPVDVALADQRALGPTLTVQPGFSPPPPPPPGKVTVNVSAHYHQYVIAAFHDEAGRPLPAGTQVQVTATTPAGRSGSGAVTL